MSSVSLIVPTLNESDNIDLLLHRVFAIKELRELDLEIVFSDGSSADDTCSQIRKWQEDYPVRLIESDVNKGLSAAVIAGAAKAQGEYVLVMDADLSHPPESIPELLHPLLSGDCDMVIGSRYVRGGSTPDWPLSRKISSVLATLPARIFTDVKDPLAGFFCLRRERLVNLGREVSGFKIGLEVLATEEQPFVVQEVPIIFRDRCYGDSKMGFTVIRDYVRQLLQLVGIDFTHFLSPLAIVSLILGAAVADYLFSMAFMSAGVRPITSQWVSFLLTCGIIGGGIWNLSGNTRQRHSQHELSTIVITGVYGSMLLLFLRSAVALQLGTISGSSSGLFLLSSGTVITGYIASVCFVFSIGKKRISGELVIRFYLIAAVFYLFILRLFYINLVPLSPEENFTIEKYGAGLGGSPVFPDVLRSFVYKFVMLLTDNARFSFRFAALGVWWIALVCMFNLSRDMLDRSIAFKTTLLFSTLPFIFFGTFGYTDDTILVLVWSGSLYVLNRFLVVGDRRAWVYAAIIPVLAVCYEPFSLVLLLGSGLYLVLHIRNRSYREKHHPMAWMILVCVTSALLWKVSGFCRYSDFQNGVSWINQLAGPEFSSSPALLLILITPVPLLATVFCAVKCGKANGHSMYPYKDLFKPEKKQFFLLLFVLPFVAGLLMSVIKEDYSWCGGVVWLAALPCISVTYTRPGPGNHRKIDTFLYRGWWITVLFLIPIYGYTLLGQVL
ncbi:glycosyltransferase [Desulfopila sp. IMCC35008]|uniref:glycosyltransferase n=1 Tax=Desulfopila sp. IMCC35008 TaxID=2653858 RepID=UPI0013D8BF69|nr:glycosyltransferase [Desulfopila sp. IMCC35008]